MSYIRILFLCVFSTSLYAVHGGRTLCDDGWLAFLGYCYLFGHHPQHFTEAEHYCRQHNGHLIEVYSKYENDFIKETLRQRNSAYYWIGMTDEMVEGTFQWYSSQSVVNFTDWHSDQPGHDGEQDCVIFNPGSDFQWHDQGCNESSKALCKKRGYEVCEPVSEIIG